jgi:hypothetical protein
MRPNGERLLGIPLPDLILRSCRHLRWIKQTSRVVAISLGRVGADMIR